MPRQFLVLVVDPDAALGDRVRAALESSPERAYDVRATSDGSTACRILGTELVDLAIVGEGLTRPASEDIISAFAADAYQACRFVALVGWPVPENTTRMLDAGAAACLPKPFETAALRACVEENLGIAVESRRRTLTFHPSQFPLRRGADGASPRDHASL